MRSTLQTLNIIAQMLLKSTNSAYKCRLKTKHIPGTPGPNLDLPIVKFSAFTKDISCQKKKNLFKSSLR